MYSRGGDPYSKQTYGAQSSYGQKTASTYPGSSGVSAPSGLQLGTGSRHQTTLGASQDPDIGMYRGHAGATGHYGPQYSSLYGTASLSNSDQVSGISSKGSMGVLEGHGSYSLGRINSPKYLSGDYVSSSGHVYGHKEGLLASEKLSDYSSLDSRQYLDRRSAYLGRDLPSDTAPTYSDSVSYGRRQPEIYDRLDQSVLREQMLKTQSLQPASEDGVGRQVDYLATRSALRHPTQELDPYMRRLDSDSHGLATGARSSYGGQRTSSILGTAPQRNVDDMYPQSAADPGYGVSLPPGRDYGLGKGLLDITPTKDVPGSISSGGGYPRMDDWNAERTAFSRDLDLRDESYRRERLYEREKEREKERERARIRERERERERDRDREREREREHERERDRKRLSNLPERERDRDHRRPLEVKQSRTPLRISRERHTSSLTRHTMHRDSPRPGILHRLHSPVKEKRREYVCKISASGLTMEERSFLSIYKRYPRLYISPDFSKLVVNWPRVDLKLSFHTPVSFEHDYIEEVRPAADKMEHSLKQPGIDTKNAEPRSTVWNAKMILMSGLSRRAVEEMSSDKVSENHIPHICSSLRFAILKKERSLMAIGGRWDPIDGGDPATNNSSLVQTVLRCAKDMTGLDLQNCQHWNRFLEIHYDRVGENGLFSHKEITVIFVPDLSDCLPSLDAWREQWLAHKKAVAERERQIQTRRNKEKSREKVDIVKDRDGDSSKDGRSTEKPGIEKTRGKLTGDLQPGKDAVYVQKESELGLERKNNQLEKNNCIELAGELNDVKKKEVNNASSHDSTKLGKKKKVVRRVIKHAGPGKGSKSSNKVDEKAGDDKNIKSDTGSHQETPSADTSGVITHIQRKVTKKPVEGKDNDPGLKHEEELASSLNNLQTVKSDSSASGVAKKVPVKKMVKRKVIKRVLKKRIASGDAGVEKMESEDNAKNVKTENEGYACLESLDEDKKAEKAAEGNKLTISQGAAGGIDKKMSDASTSKVECKVGEIGTDTDSSDRHKDSGMKVSMADEHQKISSKDENVKLSDNTRNKEKLEITKEKNHKDGNGEQRSISKDLEKRKSVEPPRHPGLILHPKGGKGSRLISLSLSLDSLLDYTDKDVEEATFEVSLFAETLHEMLQYQMGSRLLPYLEKLRVQFVMKRNQKKRAREESSRRDRKKDESNKRSKVEPSGETKLSKSESNKESQNADEKSVAKTEKSKIKRDEEQLAAPEDVDKSKLDDQEANQAEMREGQSEMDEDQAEIDEDQAVMDEDEDPEEDPEEDPDEEEDLDQNEDPDENEEMQDESPVEPNAGGERKNDVADMQDGDSQPQNEDAQAKCTKDPSMEKDVQPSLKKDTSMEKDVHPSSDIDKEKRREVKVDGAKEKARKKEAAVDKDLLQAFRFFDRNCVGYVRLEDMRTILHSLGKCLSNRDVKELAQSALLESNNGRDDRILYEKLVRMSGLGEKN